MNKQLLSTAEDHVTDLLDPEEAARLVRRLRRISLFVRLGVELITETNDDGTYSAYNPENNMQVSARQALKMLEQITGFNSRKREADKPTGKIRVSRYGDCLFLG